MGRAGRGVRGTRQLPPVPRRAARPSRPDAAAQLGAPLTRRGRRAAAAHLGQAGPPRARRAPAAVILTPGHACYLLTKRPDDEPGGHPPADRGPGDHATCDPPKGPRGDRRPRSDGRDNRCHDDHADRRARRPVRRQATVLRGQPAHVPHDPRRPAPPRDHLRGGRSVVLRRVPRVPARHGTRPGVRAGQPGLLHGLLLPDLRLLHAGFDRPQGRRPVREGPAGQARHPGRRLHAGHRAAHRHAPQPLFDPAAQLHPAHDRRVDPGRAVAAAAPRPGTAVVRRTAAPPGAGLRGLARDRRQTDPRCRGGEPATLLGGGRVTLGLAVATWLVRLAFPLGFGLPIVGWPTPAYLPQYVGLFVVGLVAYRRGWFLAVTDRMGKMGLVAALGATVVALPVALVGSDGMVGGPNVHAFAYALWDSTFAVGICLFLLTLFRRRFNTQGRIRRFASDHAFAVYVLHAPVIVGLAVAVRGLDITPVLTFFLEAPFAVAACFAVAYLVRLIPGVRRVL
ncbi:MAG: acyltransferase family protein [Streptosporangiales bacterium]|nr:acyltransferase family protein [Streptosporangiales bacterium]